MRKHQTILLVILLCFLLLEFVECGRDVRNLARRSSRSTRRSSSSSSSSRSSSSSSSSSTTSSGSISTTAIIVICAVVPIFCSIFCVVVIRICRRNRLAKAVQPAGLTPGDNINQQTLNQQMQQANVANGDPYFQNQQQMMYPVQGNIQQQAIQQQYGMVPQYNQQPNMYAINQQPNMYAINQQQLVNGQFVVKNDSVL